MRPTDLRRLRRGVLQVDNYRSLATLARVSRQPFGFARRYVDADYGTYPWTTALRTPTGVIELTLSHEHDVRTVNEIFFRRDYGAGSPRVVVDAGANIGVSAAYFLSRRPDARVYCWEPVEANLNHLRDNLAPFGERAVVSAHALAPTAGIAEFRVEGVGRYSGLADYYEHELDTELVTVQCDAFAEALGTVIATEGRIDLLKIDTEGSEQALLDSVPDAVLSGIPQVVYEHDGSVVDTTGAALVAARSSN